MKNSLYWSEWDEPFQTKVNEHVVVSLDVRDVEVILSPVKT